ncbi:N-acetylmuramidase domain-containing protein [Paenibacillus ehimensis]|uniref:N-acetylmuramidase domain-containing protein n=1 Tax=Paenibacillus ehimensis TaxID=79264 RepID=UPI000FD6D5E9|nr:N-acetylmuramidase domain-containing protein [Paenibacillus ehimensis]
MKWKEPTFGPTPLLRSLMAANARRKAQSFDLEAEQKQLKLVYPEWAKEWLQKYKEAWYIAEASGDKEGMRKAKELADGLRDKLREMEKMPPWAQEQMQKQTVRWMEANEDGNVRAMKAAAEAGNGIREKLEMIDRIKKTSPQDAERLNDLTAKWYAANDKRMVDGKDMSLTPELVEAAKNNYSKEAQTIMAKYPLPMPKPVVPPIAPPANAGVKQPPQTGDRQAIGSIAEFKRKYGGIIQTNAQELGVDANVLAAVILVESSGSGFVDGKLKIRFENHQFVDRAGYKELFTWSSEARWKGHKFRESVKHEWKMVHTGSQMGEYAAFEFAKKLKESAAYEAISMGMGQIMGFNYKQAGYHSAREMFDDFNRGHEQQINGMIHFMRGYNGGKLLKALKNNDLRSFVTQYNGSGQVDAYTEKMEKAMETYRKAG